MRGRTVVIVVASIVAVLCGLVGLAMERRAALDAFFAGFPPSTHETAADVDGALAVAARERAWAAGLFVVAAAAAVTAICAWTSLASQPRAAKP
jgi:hypothetical protein